MTLCEPGIGRLATKHAESGTLSGIYDLRLVLQVDHLIYWFIERLKMPYKFITGWCVSLTENIHPKVPAVLVSV